LLSFLNIIFWHSVIGYFHHLCRNLIKYFSCSEMASFCQFSSHWLIKILKFEPPVSNFRYWISNFRILKIERSLSAFLENKENNYRSFQFNSVSYFAIRVKKIHLFWKQQIKMFHRINWKIQEKKKNINQSKCTFRVFPRGIIHFPFIVQGCKPIQLWTLLSTLS
jgi:hypothetical protein